MFRDRANSSSATTVRPLRAGGERTGRRSVAWLLPLLFLCAGTGCQTTPARVPSVTYTPHGGAASARTAPRAAPLPLPPAPTLSGGGPAARPPGLQPPLAPPPLPEPASRPVPETAAAPAGDRPGAPQPAPAALAPSDTSAGSAVAGPLAAPAAAAAGAGHALAEARPSAESALEARLAALEQQFQERLTALQTIESEYQTQHAELAHMRSLLEASRAELRRLEQTVGTQHQRDVESLEELSRTLDQLLKAADDPPESQAPITSPES